LDGEGCGRSGWDLAADGPQVVGSASLRGRAETSRSQLGAATMSAKDA
jgi:hypothetical protein